MTLGLRAAVMSVSVACLALGFWAGAAEGKKKIVFVAAAGSHGFGYHAYKAGFMLFAKILNENAPNVEAVVVTGGWPKDTSVLDDAAAIVLGSDGGALPAQHTQELYALIKKGVGLACIHYTVDVPQGAVRPFMLDAIGGYYEQGWSVNPTWEADFKELPNHPITRGVRPFKISDEWYYHMRFRDEMKGVTPILSAIPPDSTRKGPDGPHSGNPTVRSRMGMPEVVAWAYERPGGGRGFGYTGGHFHWNWAHDDLRKLVLNALVWIAGAEVPPDGVPSKTPTVDDLLANLESQPPTNWTPYQLQRMIEQFNRRP